MIVKVWEVGRNSFCPTHTTVKKDLCIYVIYELMFKIFVAFLFINIEICGLNQWKMNFQIMVFFKILKTII